jgi:hypothetical protein
MAQTLAGFKSTGARSVPARHGGVIAGNLGIARLGSLLGRQPMLSGLATVLIEKVSDAAPLMCPDGTPDHVDASEWIDPDRGL